MKHIEVLLDGATQKYRVKDESDAVSYANFLQFDSIQQLLDQCKQHASKMEVIIRDFPYSCVIVYREGGLSLPRRKF